MKPTATRRSLLCSLLAASALATPAGAGDAPALMSITADAAATIADILRAKGVGIGTWPNGTHFVAHVGTTTLAPNRTAASGFLVQRNGRSVAGLHEIANAGDIITIGIVRVYGA